MQTLLEMLAARETVSGEEISRALGISRAAVWKRVEALRQEGWEIQSRGKLGYCLKAGDRIDPLLWLPRLQTEVLGHGWVHYARETASTNADMKRLAMEGAPGGSLCLCETQTAGRGRVGRQWVSPPEVGLWQSLLVRPKLHPQNASLVTFCAALAMADAVEEACGLQPLVKWPNDLVLGGRKICGILLEASVEMEAVDYIVVGVGLNVRRGSVPPELAAQAACLEDFAPPPLRRLVLVNYLRAMEGYLQRAETTGWEGLSESYAKKSCTLGQRVRVSGAQEFTGVAEAVDVQGALLVRDEAGNIRRVMAGDVSVRGVMGYA